MENQEPYLKVLSEAGNSGGVWLCSSAEAEGVCPRCGERAEASGEIIVMDWEGNGVLGRRYASYCDCGQSWVEEAEVGLHRIL